MAAGGPGDHPLSDILDYKLKVYGKECDGLIESISKYASRKEMLETFDWFNKDYFKDPSKFASVLKVTLEKFVQDRKERGWEM